MKYIVKNCPCFNNERFIEDYLEDGDNYCPYKEIKCQDCTDCLIKRVIDKCKENYTSDDNVFDVSRKIFAQQILDIFEIQE